MGRDLKVDSPLGSLDGFCKEGRKEIQKLNFPPNENGVGGFDMCRTLVKFRIKCVTLVIF